MEQKESYCNGLFLDAYKEAEILSSRDAEIKIETSCAVPLSVSGIRTAPLHLHMSKVL